MTEIKNALDKAVDKLGQTNWYLVLHYYRFLKILGWVWTKVPKGTSGLEIGIWPGYLGLSLANSGYKITGIDLEPKRIADLGFPVLQINLNANKLPFPANNFDFATCSEVIEHLEPAKIIDILQEIKRVLKPNGFLFITTPNRLRLGQLINKNHTRVDEHGHGHEQEYNLNEIKKIAKNAGFKIQSGGEVSFYSGIGKSEENKYFFPLFGFFKYRNKKRNFIKLLLYPFLKFIPSMRDSLYIILIK